MAASHGIKGIGVVYFTRMKLCKDSREITAQRVAGYIQDCISGQEAFDRRLVIVLHRSQLGEREALQGDIAVGAKGPITLEIAPVCLGLEFRAAEGQGEIIGADFLHKGGRETSRIVGVMVDNLITVGKFFRLSLRNRSSESCGACLKKAFSVIGPWTPRFATFSTSLSVACP